MPAPAVPADAISILARTGPRVVVRYVAENPGSYYGDIREATASAISPLTRDLRLLEEAGVIRTDVDHPIGSRRGRSPRYTVDTDRIDRLLNDLRSQLLGDSE